MALQRLARHSGLLGITCAVMLVGLLLSATAIMQPSASAHAWSAVSADASCAQLARLDPTATNGPTWGATLLAGHNASGGWFGVDVCGNGINTTAPGGANLSCTRVPTSLARTGCAPGQATYDGFGLSFQCVELVARFAAWAFSDAPGDWLGNAPDLWIPGNHPRDFIAISNGSGQAPVPGDVLVWGTVDAQGQPWPNGPADGHVAVVAAVRGGQLTFVEENALAGNKNVPSETTSLQHTSAGWIVGSAQASAPGTRALYGWLHSAKNTGTWTGQRVAHGVAPSVGASAPSPSAVDPTRQLPSLATAVVVAPSGSLADLTWSTASSPLPSSSAPVETPHLVARGLGASGKTTLASEQTPAVLMNGSNSRTVYALGRDGQLYAARMAPGVLGVQWLQMGNPTGHVLSGSPVAAYFAAGVEVAALDTSGHMWWRGGPDGNLGGWMAVGTPPNTVFSAVWLAGAPGSGLPLAVGLGTDGRLYSARWADGGGTASGWDGWTAITVPGTAGRLVGPLIGVDELAASSGTATGWSDRPFDLLVTDSFGQLKLARLTSSGAWQVQSLWVPAPLTSLISAAPVSLATASASSTVLIHVYATDATGLKLGEVTLNTLAGTVSTHWESLAASNQATSGSVPTRASQAIAVGDGQSLLIVPTLSGLALAGTADALQVALPASGVGTPPPATSVGKVAGAAGFADPFIAPALDTRWVVLDAAGTPALSNGALALPPAAAPDAALLLQQAPTGDATLETAVTLPAGAPADLQAGLVLFLDSANWLTLTLSATGQVTLCAEAWAVSAPCHSVALAAGTATTRNALLKVTRSGDSYSATESTDGRLWTTVGSWTPVLPAGVAPGVLSDAASPGVQNRDVSTRLAQPTVRVTAPLAFTAAGLFATEDGHVPATAAAWPQFAHFTVSSAGAP